MRVLICLGIMLFSSTVFAQTQQVKADYSKYIQKYLGLLRNSPNNYYYNLKLAYFYSISGKYRNAEEHYKVAIKYKSGAIEAQLGLCLVYAYQAKESEVEKLAKTILKEDKYNYYGHIYLAGTYQRQKRFKESEAVLKKILVVYPADIALLDQLRGIYLADGNTSRAAKITKLIGEISD